MIVSQPERGPNGGLGVVEETLRETVAECECRAAQCSYRLAQVRVFRLEIARWVEAFERLQARGKQLAAARPEGGFEIEERGMNTCGLKHHGAQIFTVEHQQIEHRQPFRPCEITR